MRISSTRLPKQGGCYRAAAFGLTRNIQSNEAMAFGSVVHAAIEHRLNEGDWPELAQMLVIPGNYEDPAVSMLDYPGVWHEAEGMFPWLEDNVIDLVNNVSVQCEVDVEGWATRPPPGITFGGYIDALEADVMRITDWKTRSSFAYAPRGADFANDVQLRYYAALACRALGWPEVTVRHVNILRPSKGGPALLIEEFTHQAADLYEFFGWVVESALYLKDHIDHPNTAATQRTKCMEYGGCAFADLCAFGDGVTVFGGAYKEKMMQVNSPQAAPNAALPPIPQRPPVDMKSVKPSMVEHLPATIAALAELVASDPKWYKDIPRVGKKGAQDIEAELAEVLG